MENFTRAEQREIENLATNTPNLKNHKGHGIDRGKAKKGFYILKDRRVIKLSDLGIGENPDNDDNNDYLELAKRHGHDMRNLKGIALDANGTARAGFFAYTDADDSVKYVSKKRLLEAEEKYKADLKKDTEAARNKEVNEPEQV